MQPYLIGMIFLKVVFMAQGKRNRLSAEQRADMRRRWKAAGESLHEIGRAFGKGHGSIRFLLTQGGGIVSAVRRRSPRTLTPAEREDISRGIASGSSIREIAKGLQRAASTVSREVARHGGRPQYRANEADSQAWESALRPKTCRLATHVKLRTIVASKLTLDWSPEQISGWLKIRYPRNESMRVSHETIYRNLFIQARGVLKKELVQQSGELATSGSPARILPLSALSSFCIATAILISPFRHLVAVQASGSTSGYAGKVTYEPPGGSIPR
jgi:IS30 family transposase